MPLTKERIIELTSDIYNQEPEVRRLESENNKVFLLDFHSFKKVMKIAPEERKWLLDKEMRILDLTNSHGIPTPKVEHHNKDKGKFPGRWYIMSFLGKENLNLCADKSWAKKLFIKSGKLFAEIHKISLERQGTITSESVKKESFKDYATKTFNRCLKGISETDLLTPREIRKAKKIFSDLPSDREKRLCHNDFGPWQVIVKDNEINGIIDWEFSRSSSTAYDLAKSEVLTQVFSKNFDLIKKGYKRKRKLPKNYVRHKESLKVLTLIELMNFFKGREQKTSKIKSLFNELVSSV